MDLLESLATPPLHIRSTEDGLHLEGSILSFDALHSGDLSFLSSVLMADSRISPQVIATEETIRLLESQKRRPKALICQYNRPFSIGRLKMELLPAGGTLGGALLHVEVDNKRILYAPNPQVQKNDIVRNMQLKKANTLILGAYYPTGSGPLPSRRKERERLLEETKKHIAQGQYPTIVCQPIPSAQEITKLLTDADIPVAVHPRIFRLHKIYEAFGSKLGAYSKLSNRTRRKVIIVPSHDLKQGPLYQTGEAPVMVVENSPEDIHADGVLRKATRFFINSFSDAKELREIISAVAPKELYIFGPYTKSYVEEFKGLAPRVRPLYPYDQPTLF